MNRVLRTPVLISNEKMPIIKRTCEHCGIAFSRYARPNELARGRFRHCSIDCANKAKQPPTIREKNCSSCGEMKSADHFVKWKSVCRACRAKKQRDYNERNRQRVREINNASQKRHRKARNANGKRWRAANPEKVKEIQRRADAKLYSRRRAVLLASPERQAKARAAVRSWNRRNSERWAVYYHRRRARLAAVENSYSLAEWQRCKDYFGHRCAYCLEPAPLEMEHMVPISRGGPHVDANIVPACERCNLSKSSRTIIGWLLAKAR